VRSFFHLLLIFILFVSVVTDALSQSGRSDLGIKKTNPIEEHLWKPLQISHFGWIYGSGLDFKSNRNPDDRGVAVRPVTMTNQLSIAYDTGRKLVPVVVTPLVTRLFESRRITAQDPTVGVQGLLYNHEGMIYWARYEYIVPAMADTRKKGDRGGIQAVNVWAYAVPKTRLWLRGVFVPSIKHYENSQWSSFWYMSPQIGWQLTPTATFWIFMEHFYERARYRPSGFGLTKTDPAHLAFSVRWNFSNVLWIQPFINTYPTGSVSLRSAHWGMNLGGTLK
jgi:hypothetical protein